MDSTGERLRSAREAAGISLEEIAARLKRPVHQIQAIEENRFEVLGGAVYVRGFLRNYCKLLRLDEDEIFASLPDNLQQNQPAAFAAEHPAHTLKVADSARRRRVGVILAAIVAVLSVSAWLMSDHGEEQAVSPQPQALATPSEGPDVRMIDLGSTEGEKKPVDQAESAPEPSPATSSVPVKPTSAPAETQSGDALAFGATVTLRASDRCWVHIERDGETYRDVTLYPDEDWVVTIRPGDRMTLGNAGVIRLRTPSGEWVGPLGEEKKVLRHWDLINADGSLHLPPAPPVPPHAQEPTAEVAPLVQDQPVSDPNAAER